MSPPGPIDPVFTSGLRVRFDEAGADGNARTSSLLRYAQDLAWMHSGAGGFDRSWYDQRGINWLVRAARLEIRASIPVGSTILGTTEVVGFRRVWSRRRSTFRLDGSPVAAVVDIDWLLLDARGAPTRIPPIFAEVFGTPGTPVVLGRVDVGRPTAGARRQRLVVRPQELDPLGHVNNAVYADWLDEAVIAAGGDQSTRIAPRTVRLEYAGAAGPGEVLTTLTWPASDGWSFEVVGQDDGARLRARLEPETGQEVVP